MKNHLKNPGRSLLLLLLATSLWPFTGCFEGDRRGNVHQKELPIEIKAIGEGRNDGINRCYGHPVTDDFFEHSFLTEYTYIDGHWEESPVTDNIIDWLVLDNLRPDHTTRIIASGFTYEEGTYNIDKTFILELTYTEAKWDVDTIRKPEAGNGVGSGVLGSFHGAGSRSLITPESINGEFWFVETTYTSAGWNSSMIAKPTLEEEDYIIDFDAGDATGEGKDQLYYTTASGHLYQLNFSNGSWVKTELERIYPGEKGVSYASAFGIKVVDRGLNALFVQGVENLYEYSFEGGKWGRYTLTDKIVGPMSMVYGDWHNDGVDRLYMPAMFGKVYQVTPRDHAVHVMEFEMSGTAAVFTATIGDAHNDGINRMYVTQGYTKVYELTY